MKKEELQTALKEFNRQPRGIFRFTVKGEKNDGRMVTKNAQLLIEGDDFIIVDRSGKKEKVKIDNIEKVWFLG